MSWLVYVIYTRWMLQTVANKRWIWLKTSVLWHNDGLSLCVCVSVSLCVHVCLCVWVRAWCMYAFTHTHVFIICACAQKKSNQMTLKVIFTNDTLNYYGIVRKYAVFSYGCDSNRYLQTGREQTVLRSGFLVYSQNRMGREYKRLCTCVMEMYKHIPLVSVNSVMCSMRSYQFISEWQGVTYMLTFSESCDQVFELVIDIYGGFVWVLVIFLGLWATKHTHQVHKIGECMLPCCD